MRRFCTSSLLALGLLAAPLAAVPATATATAVSSSVSAAQAGTSATARTAKATRKRTAKPVRRPVRKPVARPAAKPVAKPLAKPVVQPARVPVSAPVAPTTVTPVAAPAPAAVAPAPRTGAHAFLHVDAGQPVRWNPCADVPWTFNPAGAPAGGLAAVQAAVDELSSRTGLTFAYQGTTAEAPVGAYLQQGWKQFKPLLVAWTSAETSDLLAGRGTSTVGMARVLWTGSYDSTGANRTQIASGVVALNSATKAATTGAGSWYTYVLHELGHAVGLGHVEDSTQVMNAVISNDVTGFGSGDLVGLQALGRGAGCLPDIR